MFSNSDQKLYRLLLARNSYNHACIHNYLAKYGNRTHKVSIKPLNLPSDQFMSKILKQQQMANHFFKRQNSQQNQNFRKCSNRNKQQSYRNLLQKPISKSVYNPKVVNLVPILWKQNKINFENQIQLLSNYSSNKDQSDFKELIKKIQDKKKQKTSLHINNVFFCQNNNSKDKKITTNKKYKCTFKIINGHCRSIYKQKQNQPACIYNKKKQLHQQTVIHCLKNKDKESKKHNKLVLNHIYL